MSHHAIHHIAGNQQKKTDGNRVLTNPQCCLIIVSRWRSSYPKDRCHQSTDENCSRTTRFILPHWFKQLTQFLIYFSIPIQISCHCRYVLEPDLNLMSTYFSEPLISLRSVIRQPTMHLNPSFSNNLPTKI